jgi:lysophospholipase L1-like esterase
MLISNNSKLIMIGDSIADAERLQHLDELPTQGLGHGYVSYVAGLLGAVYPEKRIEIINRGISGNTVRDLKYRWQKDVLELHPDWLSIKFDTLFVNVQGAFDRALSIYNPAELADDKVHPNQIGHMIIARAFLDAVQFAW